ncbi:hypothetical protein [Dolosigranulum pigrum]|uniref:Uncharacterized protein n=1 Tax=Dolosigranulum pigrum TaxID=29394 RepID=A0A516GHN0_9LACT|nr:hypothetical protein [Dolosigranulum pigrum]QDO91033.1 hypothetical protein FNV33_02830 [Dolosigranulum pigrum]
MGMDDGTAKSNAKRYYCSIINLNEQQDQLSQTIDKATNNKEIAGFYQREAQTEENYEQGVKAETVESGMTPSKLKEWQSRR